PEPREVGRNRGREEDAGQAVEALARDEAAHDEKSREDPDEAQHDVQQRVEGESRAHGRILCEDMRGVAGDAERRAPWFAIAPGRYHNGDSTRSRLRPRRLDASPDEPGVLS